MNIKPVMLTIIVLGSGMARAEVQVETSCYSMVPPGKSSKPIRLALRTYIDQDMKKEVGAFIQYNGSKINIPLVLTKHVNTDTDAPDLGNYETTRIEIVEKKVAGEYVFAQTGAGVTQGRYVKYRNGQTGKIVTFQQVGDDQSCTVNY